MKKSKHVYKICTKFKKHPELLTKKYGFIPYQAEGEEEIIYARGIKLSEDNSIFKYLKRCMEKIYMKATTAEREADFKDYEFKEILTPDQKRDYELVLTDSIRKEFSECQICFANNGLGAWTMFINAPDRVEYYNTEVIDECASDIIKLLLIERVIYRAKAPKQK